MNNVNPMTNLEKHWKRLHMTLTVDNQVSVRQIAKTFASGRAAEKLVYSTLSDCGFPSGKVSKIVYFGGAKKVSEFTLALHTVRFLRFFSDFHIFVKKLDNFIT